MTKDDRLKAADRIAYLLLTHPALVGEDEQSDAMEDFKSVAPEGWVPPADRSEAQRRWEESWPQEVGGDETERATEDDGEEGEVPR